MCDQMWRLERLALLFSVCQALHMIECDDQVIGTLLVLLNWWVHVEISAWWMKNLRLSWVSSVHSGKERYSLSNQAKTASFHIPPNNSDTRRSRVWYTNSAVKQNMSMRTEELRIQIFWDIVLCSWVSVPTVRRERSVFVFRCRGDHKKTTHVFLLTFP